MSPGIIGPEFSVVNECDSAIIYAIYLYLTLLVSSDNFPGNGFLVVGIGGSLLQRANDTTPSEPEGTNTNKLEISG